MSQMVLSTKLRTLYLTDKREARRNRIKRIVFADIPAPSWVETVDVSEAQDGGVVMWYNDDMVYISTQREGIKVIAPENCCQFFRGCYAMESVDGSMLDTSQTTDMEEMFGNCQDLRSVDGLSNWDVSNVKNMSRMFERCTRLLNVDGLQSWDVSNVENMRGMFAECFQLENTNGLYHWNTANVKFMDFMFFYCVSLKDTNGLWHWNTAQVLNFNNMFCKANISSVGNLCCWEVQKANSMNQMFFQCNQLTNLAGLEKWDIGCVTNMMGMFAKCSLLFDTSALESWKTKFKDTVHQEKIFADCNEMAIAPSWYSVEA